MAMLNRLYVKLSGLGLVAVLIAGGWALWVHRGYELALAKARQDDLAQALSAAQSAVQSGQQTISDMQAQQAANNSALAQVSAASVSTASAAATINAQISTSQDGPVAPVLAQTLATLAKAQGENQ